MSESLDRRCDVPVSIGVMAMAYVACLLAGAMALGRTGATVAGRELSTVDALYHAADAITLTGLSTGDPARFTSMGLTVIVILTAAGMLIGLAITALAVVRIADMGYSDRRVLGACLGYSAVIVAAGSAGMVDPNASGVHALPAALAAFSRSGIAAGAAPSEWAPRTHLVLMPLAVLGGLGIPVLMQLVDRLRGRLSRLCPHSRRVIGLTAGLYLVGLIGLLATLGPTSPTSPAPGAGGWTRTLASASVGAINSTVGLPIQDLNRLATAPLWIMAMLMLVGAAPAANGGGIGPTTLACLAGARPGALRRGDAGAALGYALVWIGLLGAVVGAAFITMLALNPAVGADRILFNTLSAATHAGLDLDMGATNAPSHAVLAATLLITRVIPWMLIWSMATKGDGDHALP